MKEKIDWRIIITAILGITIIEVVALIKGLNGALLTLAVAAIAGLSGWVLPSPYMNQLKGGAKNG